MEHETTAKASETEIRREQAASPCSARACAPAHPVLQLLRLGNQATGRMARAAALAVQQQTDVRPRGETSVEAVPEECSEEFDDAGSAVAGIEAGAPGGGRAGPPPEESNAGTRVQRQPAAAPARPSQERVSPAAVLGRLGAGSPLDSQLRGRMESAFGSQFDGVQCHADDRGANVAAALGARAFTVGEHIAFARGEYQPSTAQGARLVAHELAHVVQQRRGLSGAILGSGIGEEGDEYEQEAERAAEAAVAEPADGTPRREEQGASGSASLGAVLLYRASAAADYARKWATSTNTAYGRFDNDCTNFVSQAMDAGGWKYLFGKDVCEERKNDNVWWFERDLCRRLILPNVHASHTWGGAQNFYKFVQVSGRGTLAASVGDLRVGDVLQKGFGGSVGHSMVVTKVTPTNLYLTYHTSDHLDEPFFKDGKNPGILSRNPSPPNDYYGWKIS